MYTPTQRLQLRGLAPFSLAPILTNPHHIRALAWADVAPDGSAAEPSAENVPYRPEKFLRASPKGVREGDFVFLLGFPGSTMRYAPASRLAYSDEVAV